jgi:4-hydroxythreonine-4-phosphate dehydrogenase
MKPIAITMGEPAGIGGECILAAWRARYTHKLPAFFCIDNIKRLRALDGDIPIQEIATQSECIKTFENALPVLDLDLPALPVPGKLTVENGQAVLESINEAVKLALSDDISAIVTNPIHKGALYETGFSYPGHTEYLAALCGSGLTPLMMLAAKGLNVVPATIHIPLKEVSENISIGMIQEKARILAASLRQDFNIADPHIAVAGLNPHAGEEGNIGKEEQDIILPAIESLKAEGIRISGPFPADTMFHEAARAGYDAALCMYHDQALIPLKTLDFFGGVNITLGLPIVRTSPDHGTALDIAGQGRANPDSLINAIKVAAQISLARAQSDPA